MTIRFDESEHDKLMILTLDKLSEDGYTNINAECKNFQKPDIMYTKNFQEGFSPDITAEKDGKKFIIEIETRDSIFTETTEKQWQIFSDNAQYYKSKFIVVVKEDLKSEAERQREDLGVDAEIITI